MPAKPDPRPEPAAGEPPPAPQLRRDWSLRGVHAVYQLLWHLFLPLVLAMLLWRSRREPEFRRRLHQRLGLGGRTVPGAVWVHAVSMGELRSAEPLVRALVTAGHRVLLTHATSAGWHGGRQAFADELADGRVRQVWVPFDLVWAVALFLRRHRPRMGLLVEGEIWPAQVLTALRLRIPLAVVNGNLTDHALQRDSGNWLGRQRLKLFTAFVLALTKSPAHAARYRAVGLPAERVIDVGELRAETRPRADLVAAAAPVRAALAADRPGVFLIASSVVEEEAALLGLVRSLQRRLRPAPAIVWVPRHPPRFAPLCALLARAGITARRRSEVLDADLRLRRQPGEMMVGDSLGEMDFYYALADVVFVGASLNGEGGHNIVEPLAQHKPVVMGPSLYGIAGSAPPALACGALRALPDAGALEDELVRLFSTPAELADFAARTRRFSPGDGAAARSLTALQPWLGAPD